MNTKIQNYGYGFILYMHPYGLLHKCIRNFIL